MFYVYAHYRSTDPHGNPFYIGKGKANRDTSHKRNPYWKNIVAKHGFVSKKIKENLTEDEAWGLEKSLIQQYGKLSDGTGCLCNLADGGEGASGTIHSEETKKKWSIVKKGKTWEEIYGIEGAKKIREKRKKTGRKSHSAETKKKLSLSKIGDKNPMYGKSPTPEHSKKLSESKIGKPSNSKGKKYSETTRQKFKQAAILRALDPEIRNKISKSLTGIVRSEETKKRMSEAAKKREAEKKLNKKETRNDKKF
jgi:hypothetical protein